MNRFLLALFALFVVLFVAGCGGAGFDPTQFMGTYHGTVTLDNNKAGDLTLVSDAEGLVSGSLVVTGADGTDTTYKFTAGTYSVAGSLTSLSGNFEVNGEVPDQGDFFIRGSFPTDGSTRTFKVITGTNDQYQTSQTYIGSLSKV